MCPAALAPPHTLAGDSAREIGQDVCHSELCNTEEPEAIQRSIMGKQMNGSEFIVSYFNVLVTLNTDPF